LTNVFCFSQNLEFLNYTTNNQSEIIKEMVVDINENVIQLIQTKPKVLSQLFNPFKIRKINNNGVELWTRVLDVQDAVSIDTDSNGNIFLLGSSNGTTDLNPDPNTINSFFTNNSGAGFGNNEALFILKLNSSGVFQNFATIGAYPNCNGSNGCSLKSYPLQLKIDNSDNVLFTFKPRRGGLIDIDPSLNIQNLATTSINYFTLIKWSNNLDTLLWVNYLSGQQVEVLTHDSIDVTPKAIFFDLDSNNNIYIATLNSNDVFLSKYSSNGILLNNPSLTKITSYKQIILSDINVLSNNEIILGGQFINYIDVNPIIGNSSQLLSSTYPILTEVGSNVSDAFIVKYDSNFNVIWKQKISSYRSDEIEDIESYDGKIYIVGISSDPTVSSFEWVGAKAFLKILNSDGTTFNEKLYISPYPENAGSSSGVIDLFKFPFKNPYIGESNFGLLDWCKRNIALKNQKLYISGEYSACGSHTSNPFPLYYSTSFSSGFDWNVCSIFPSTHQTGSNTIPINWLIRPYTAKYNLLVCNNLSEENNIKSLENKILIYPNPTNKELFIKYNLIITEIEIYNPLGQLVYSKIINGNSEVINIENLSSGEYYLKVRSEKNILTSMFIKY
jgi:hypothetical protein